VLLGWPLSHSFPSPVPTVPLPSFSPDSSELPETAQVQFNNARQTPEELLEDWVDRVMSLATRAFRELPEKHMYQQVVVRLCQGAADKEAESYAHHDCHLSRECC
jgi:hypothetical protein